MYMRDNKTRQRTSPRTSTESKKKVIKMTSKKLLTAILAGALAATTMTAKAQSNIELMQTTDKATSRVRPNLFYGLPFGVKGYTFIEFYEDGKSYYAKTGLTKKIKGGLDARVEVLDFSAATDKIGIGLEYKIPTKEETFAKVKVMPVYFGFDGKYAKPKVVMGFYFEQKIYVPILKDAKVVAFGEINIAAKGGPTWSYGELHVQKSLDDFILGIGTDLTCDGNITPHCGLSIKLGYMFGHK
jgi:hypothetical protein